MTPSERAQKEIEETERFTNRYLGLGILIGTPWFLYTMATIGVDFAVFKFVMISAGAFVGIGAASAGGRMRLPVVMMGLWLGGLFAFVIAMFYNSFLPLFLHIAEVLGL